jgi:hypothetical protein
MQQLLHWLWVVFTIFMVLVSSLDLSWFDDLTHRPSSGPAAGEQIVTDDGFDLRLAGVTISGDAGAAPAGTPIRAELIEPEIPASISDFAEPVGTGVDITLGDGMQPATPLTITFAPNEVEGWYAATGGDDDVMPVVFASNDGDLGVEFADAELMADGSVVVTTHHLSRVYPGVTSARRFSDELFNQAAIFLGARSEQPGCVGQATGDEAWTFSPIPDQLVWPCASQSAGALEVALTNNSAHVWIVTTTQATPGYPNVLAFPGTLIAAVALQGLDRSSASPLLPPNGGVTFTTADPGDEIVFSAELNPPLTVINAVVSSAASYLPSEKVQRFLTVAGSAECLIGFVEEAFETDKVPDGNYARTLVGCIGTIVGGLSGNLISSVTAVPGAAVTFMDGAGRSMAGTDQFTFTVSRGETTTRDAGSAWPTGRNDAPGALYTWLGANFYGMPDWVACDNARAYCLVGYDREEHLLVQMDGLEPMYWLDDEIIDDPRAALLSVGLPDNIVREILGE